MNPKEEFYPEIRFRISQNLCEDFSIGALINQPPLLDTTEGLGEAQ